MDFLPHPSSGVGPLDIPFVADAPYQFGSYFWDFPKVHGFGDQWASLPAPRLAALVQSWLYFGTISEFLGRPIDYEQFHDNSDECTVTAKPLIPLLNEWVAAHVAEAASRAAVDGEAAGYQRWRMVLFQHARFLESVLRFAEDFDKVSQSHIKPIPSIILSVKVLCTALRGLLYDLADYDADDYSKPWPSPTDRMRREFLPATDTQGKPNYSPSTQVLLEAMFLRGWCPYLARKVLTSFNYANAYYFTRLYRVFSKEVNHDNCTDGECIATNADLFEYVPRHVHFGCICQPKVAPMDQIRAIIEAGGIPLIRLRPTKTGVRIEVVRMTARTRFVVVSHVWSAGIGNKYANALPECQLRRLYAHLSNLKPLSRHGARDSDFNLLNSLDMGFQTATPRRPKYLWIDVLCMPPKEGPTAFLRIQAINKLPAVYQAADRILVLDSKLETLSVHESDILEQFSRFAVSPWFGRCWTFQEAALASACEVQGADGTFDAFFPQIPKALTSGPLPPRRQQTPLLTALTHPIGQIKILLSRKSSGAGSFQPLDGRAPIIDFDANTALMASMTRSLNQEFRSAFSNGIKPEKTVFGEGTLAPDFCTLFVQVWNELSKRSTSMPGDMPIIMANLLGFNSEPIMRLPKSSDRMACILRSMDGIPVSLLFNLFGLRHEPGRNHRDRWLPVYPSRDRLAFGSTFTNLRVVGDDMYMPNNCVSRKKVAVLVCTGPPDPFSSSTFTVRDVSTGERYAIELHRSEGDEFATPEIGPYIIAIQLDPELNARPEGLFIEGLDAIPRVYAGALFRVRRVVTRVKKVYSHNLDEGYDDSFELVEDEGGNALSDEISSKRSTDYLSGDISAAFGRYECGLLRTIYDCPMTVTRLPGGGAGDPLSSVCSTPLERPGPILTAQPLPPTWQIVIERGKPTPLSPLFPPSLLSPLGTNTLE